MIKRTDLNVISEAPVDVSEHGAPPVEKIKCAFFVGGSALDGTQLDKVMESEHLPTSPLTQSVGEDWPFVSDGSHIDTLGPGYGR